MTQNNQIRAYLKQGNTLTALEALNMFQCMRLASRINDIENLGQTIDREKLKLPSGKTVSKYFISEAVIARRYIENVLKQDNLCTFAFNEIETVYRDFHEHYKFKDLELPEVVKLLKQNFCLIPF